MERRAEESLGAALYSCTASSLCLTIALGLAGAGVWLHRRSGARGA